MLRSQRLAAQTLGGQAGADVCVVRCTAPEAVIASRLASRAIARDTISDADWAIYREQQHRYEPVTYREGPGMAVNTTGEMASVGRRVLRWLNQPASFGRA